MKETNAAKVEDTENAALDDKPEAIGTVESINNFHPFLGNYVIVEIIFLNAAIK